MLGGMESRLRFWSSRGLTLGGKVLVLNTLFLSKLWYTLSVTPMSLGTYSRLKALMLRFLWGEGRAMIAYDTLIAGRDMGGLGLLDPWVRMKSLRVKLVRRFLDGRCSGGD